MNSTQNSKVKKLWLMIYIWTLWTLKSKSVTTASAQKYSGQITTLREEFARRFANFKTVRHEFNFVKSRFSFDVETVADELQMELVDLQANNALKNIFDN